MRVSLAAACARAGAAFRTSVTGEPRGPVCGMGVCHECRITVGDDAHQLACMLPADGAVTAPADAGAARREVRCDVLVIGGGPAGLAAAQAVQAAGADVVLVDEHDAVGGPIYRAGESPWPAPARTLHATRVVAALPDGVLAEDRAGAIALRSRSIVVASGARELLLPFPGWTLPGVFGAGGLQVLAKAGWPVEGKRVVVGGTGPLVRAAAAALRALRADVVAVVELASARQLAAFGARLVAHPGKLAQAIALSASISDVPSWTGARVRRALGDGKVEAVTIERGGRTRTIDCELVAVGFGLVPSLELPLLLGLEVADGRVVVDAHGATSAPGIWCAGEATGIGGLAQAIATGELAGWCAAGSSPPPRLVRRARRARAFAALLASAFPPPRGWGEVLDDDTVVCRCEDVRWGALREGVAASDARGARLHTRAGMGACQGRVCGAALAVVRGFSHPAVRPPIAPARLETLTTTRRDTR